MRDPFSGRDFPAFRDGGIVESVDKFRELCYEPT